MTSENKKEYFLMGMGNPLLDISAVVPKSMIEKYDGVFGNAIMAGEKQLPVYDELVNKYKVSYIAGGSTQNSLRVFSWASKGKPACFFGCIGKDKFGKTLQDQAEQAGLKGCYLIDEKTPTGTCAVLVVGKERSLIANLSAANNYKIDHLKKNQLIMESSKNFYIAGYFLTVSPDSMEYVAKHAVKENKPFMMNIAATFIPNVFKKQFLQLLPYCDLLFGNEDEALALATALGWKEKKIADIANKVRTTDKVNKKRDRIVVFTQGKNPVIIATKEKTFEVKVPLVSKDKIVDSNGAGDAFCGGFLSQFVLGKDLTTCAKVGIYCSSVVIQRSGCTFPKEFVGPSEEKK